jgi:hypothetical protein
VNCKEVKRLTQAFLFPYVKAFRILLQISFFLILFLEKNTQMKYLILILVVMFSSIDAKAQSCKEFISYVKAKSYGTTYSSFDSDAISKVTFYQVSENYQTLHFAIVCFKQKYS